MAEWKLQGGKVPEVHDRDKREAQDTQHAHTALQYFSADDRKTYSTNGERFVSDPSSHGNESLKTPPGVLSVRRLLRPALKKQDLSFRRN